MREFTTIVESVAAPSTDKLWIDSGVLKYYDGTSWKAFTSSGCGCSIEISKQNTWVINGVDTGKPSKGVNGYNGEDGITPKIGPNGNWWICNTDTGVLASGANGKPGENGITPHIGSNYNWFIAQTDTGVLARGTNGKDGDPGPQGPPGVGARTVFAFKVSAIIPATPTGGSWNPETDVVTYPVGWSGDDTQEGIVWMSHAVFNTDGNLDKGGWSKPIRMTGEGGTNGENGNSIRIMYAKTDGSDETPPVVEDNINPGSIWGTAMPTYTGNEAIWGIQAIVSYDNKLVTNWQGPYLITGINGKNGTPVNYKTYVFRQSDDKPLGPTSNDPENPGNGWVDYPNTSGNWWQCIGSVNGVTGLVTEWSEVLPLNGKDGTAQDGKFTEFRFAKSSTDTAPSITKTVRTPSGWTLTFPTLNEGDIMWMTKAVINPDDTLYSNWEDPVRISGERGPQGHDGPAGQPGAPGSQGVSGIPGVSYELRYSLGVEDSFDATWNTTVASTRNPSSYGWTTELPATTEAKPYIWMTQARIKLADNDDTVGSLQGTWSEPFRLSGVNGLDGAPGPAGKKGQVVYPMGVYSNTTSYTTTDTKAPYVYDPSDGNFYVLNAEMTWLGTQQDNRTPSQDFAANGGKYWLKFDSFEAIYAKIGIIANGLIGSAVFNGDYMFSQQGVDSNGTATSNYEGFGTDAFTPNFQVNFNTGEIQAKKGSISSGLTSKWTMMQISKDYTSKRDSAGHVTVTFDIDPSNLATNNLLLIDNWSNVNESGLRWSIEVNLPVDISYIGSILNINIAINGLPSDLTFDQVQHRISSKFWITGAVADANAAFAFGYKKYFSVSTFNSQSVTLIAEPYAWSNGTVNPPTVSRCIWRVTSPGFKGGTGVVMGDPNIYA